MLSNRDYPAYFYSTPYNYQDSVGKYLNRIRIGLVFFWADGGINLLLLEIDLYRNALLNISTAEIRCGHLCSRNLGITTRKIENPPKVTKCNYGCTDKIAWIHLAYRVDKKYKGVAIENTAVAIVVTSITPSEKIILRRST